MIDCDPGNDDASAILMALSDPDVDVIAITCVEGNTNVRQTALNALRTLQVANRLDVSSGRIYHPFLFNPFPNTPGVLRGSVVKCLTRNPGVLGSSLTGSFGFFRGSVLGQDTSEPQPSTGETQERHE